MPDNDPVRGSVEPNTALPAAVLGPVDDFVALRRLASTRAFAYLLNSPHRELPYPPNQSGRMSCVLDGFTLGRAI